MQLDVEGCQVTSKSFVNQVYAMVKPLDPPMLPQGMMVQMYQQLRYHSKYCNKKTSTQGSVAIPNQDICSSG
jgi:hypothetical protein